MFDNSHVFITTQRSEIRMLVSGGDHKGVRVVDNGRRVQAVSKWLQGSICGRDYVLDLKGY